MFVNTLRESARPGRSSHVSGGTRTPPADARSSHRDDDDVTSATPPSDKLLASGPRDARRGRLAHQLPELQNLRLRRTANEGRQLLVAFRPQSPLFRTRCRLLNLEADRYLPRVFCSLSQWVDDELLLMCVCVRMRPQCQLIGEAGTKSRKAGTIAELDDFFACKH